MDMLALVETLWIKTRLRMLLRLKRPKHPMPSTTTGRPIASRQKSFPLYGIRLGPYNGSQRSDVRTICVGPALSKNGIWL